MWQQSCAAMRQENAAMKQKVVPRFGTNLYHILALFWHYTVPHFDTFLCHNLALFHAKFCHYFLPHFGKDTTLVFQTKNSSIEPPTSHRKLILCNDEINSLVPALQKLPQELRINFILHQKPS